MKKNNFMLAILIFIAFSAYWLIHSRNTFDAHEVAISETKMWQAYYSRNPKVLHGELVAILKEQFGIYAPSALQIAKHFVSAAVKFKQARGDYEAIILPDLEQAYEQLKQAIDGNFVPQEAARAELAWWVARRTPGKDSPEEVGRLIGRLYSVLYGYEAPEFIQAGLLRAQAADIRDKDELESDWQEIERILHLSYSKLLSGL